MTHAKAKVVYSHQGCQWGVEVMGKRLESDGKRWNCATAEVFAKGLNEILSAVSASATEIAARRCVDILDKHNPKKRGDLLWKRGVPEFLDAMIEEIRNKFSL